MSRSLNILLVDDEPRMLAASRAVLEYSGFNVLSASNAEEALRALSDNNVHIAILDLRLSDADDPHDSRAGLSLANSIDPSVPKIIFTGFPDYDAVRSALMINEASGRPLAVDFVLKTEGPEALLRAVEKVLAETVRLDLSMRIVYEGGMDARRLADAASGGRPPEELGVTEEVLSAEAEDLLRKLFSGCTQIAVVPPASERVDDTGPQSPVAIEHVSLLKVTRLRYESLGEKVTVMIGERSRLHEEYKGAPQLFESYAETQRLAAVVISPLTERNLTHWDGALVAWRNVAHAAMSGETESLERNITSLARHLGERLGSKPLQLSWEGEDFWRGDLEVSGIFPRPEPRDALPVFFLTSQSLKPQHLNQLRQEFARRFGHSRGAALLFFFASPAEVELAARLLKEKFAPAYALDVIAVGEDRLRQLITAESPARALRSLVLSQIDIFRISPFQSVGETADHIFFGRERELGEIVQHARASSYAVIAGRRFGKTSLLGQLHRARLPAGGFRTVYHDLSLTPNYEAFRRAPVRGWHGEPPPGAMQTFGELLDSTPTDRPLVLLLDEADKTVGPDSREGWRLFNTLRALSNTGHFQVVLSGEHTLRSALRDSDSPLFNFVNEMLLGPLTRQAVEELITRPMGQLDIRLQDEAQMVGRIYDFTSGHPNIVQRLCIRLVELLNDTGCRQLSLEEVNAIIEDPSFQEVDFLGTYWDRATPLEKIITLVLSQESGVHRLGAVRRLLAQRAGLDSQPVAVKEALDRLVDIRSILKRQRAGYEFAVTAFPLVLKNTSTHEDLLEVLITQARSTGEAA